MTGFNASLSDFNGDAFTDIVWRNQATGQNELWYLNGDRLQHTTALPPQSDLGWQIEATGDFDGDGHTDLVWRHDSTGQTALWLMNGTTLLREQHTLSIADQAWQIDGVGDWNHDGKSDLIWHHQYTGQTVVWYMNGATPLGAAAMPAMDPAWSLEGVGDFNGDGHGDLVWHHRSSRQLHLWYLNGTTLIDSETVNGTTPTQSQLQGVGDFNGDGHADLLWRDDGTGLMPGQLHLWLMAGTRLVEIKPLIPLPGQGEHMSDFHWQATTTGSGDRPQSLRLIHASPAITRNTTQAITWESLRLGGTVDIALYQGNQFHSDIAVQTPNDGHYDWAAPALLPQGENFRLRLSSSSDPTLFDYSDLPVAIQTPRLTLTRLNGAPILERGDSHEITWESNFSSNNNPIRIELYQAGQRQRTIQAATPNDGLYRWQIPHDLAADSDYQIRISQANPASSLFVAQDLSVTTFRIFPKPGIDIQIFDPQAAFSPLQLRALNVAVQNWEYLINRDKDRSGTLSVVLTQSPTRMDGREWSTFFSTSLAEALVDTQRNQRTNFSRGVDMGGVDYDNRINWNPEAIASMSSRQIVTTMMHELGHVLGLEHEFGDSNSLMYFSESFGIPTITASSLAALEQLGYGVNRSLADKLRWSVIHSEGVVSLLQR